jgi:diadenosine tetraphosphate (Ap4A) HIT family hydrolase
VPGNIFHPSLLVCDTSPKYHGPVRVNCQSNAPKVRFSLNTADPASDCLFCNVLRRSPDELAWHDQPLARVAEVGAVIAGLGAFVPGYVLVFPEQHVESCLSMGAQAYRAFRDLLNSTAERVATIFDSPTIFEHGSCTSSALRRSACLDHAHIHIIPGNYELADCLIAPIGLASRSSMRIARYPDSGYLFLQEPAADPIYTEDPGISQFFRRQIAGQVGEPDDWDYLLFPRWENVRETISRFHDVGVREAM